MLVFIIINRSSDLLLFKDQKWVIGWVVGIFTEFVKVYVETEN